MIFGFGKRHPDKSFKQRVTEFWQWYPQVAERFFETIERGQCQSLAKEVGDFMDRTLPGLAWVFGPGEQGGHSFTVSGEGGGQTALGRILAFASDGTSPLDVLRLTSAVQP